MESWIGFWDENFDPFCRHHKENSHT